MKLKFRNRLLLGLLFVFIPLFIAGATIAYFQGTKILKRNIEGRLSDRADVLLSLAKTSALAYVRNQLHAISDQSLDITTYYYKKYKDGFLTKDQAVQAIEEILLSRTAGKSGYIYCLDSNGKVIFHPDSKFKGTDVAHLDSVQVQIKNREGHLEMKHKIPGETDERSKTIYMAYFQPFDWIITVVAFQDEFAKLANTKDFEAGILAFRSGETGYAYIVDEDGTLLVHPTMPNINFFKQSIYPTQFLDQLIRLKSGRIQYEWQNPSELTSRAKIVNFRYLPEFKWIVASSSYVSEVYAPLKTAKTIFFATVIIIFLSSVLFAVLISAGLSKPLESMIDQLEKGTQEPDRIHLDEDGPLEFEALSRQFNTFVQQLDKNKVKMEEIIKKNLESQTALVENDLKLRSLFDQSFQYIGILSPFGVLEQINQSLLNFSGIDVENTLYRPFWEALWWRHDPDVSLKIKESVKKAMGGEFVRYETTAISKEERIRHIDISIKPVFNSAEEVAFLIAESRDITDFRQAAMERKDLAVQLERSQKMEAIGTLAGGIAHDFNNILSGILGYSQLLELSIDSPNKAKAHIHEIAQGARRAADLVQQILTFSRQTEFEKHPLRLYLVVKEALKLIRSTIPTTIDIGEFIYSKETVLADPTQMHQVIMNLCTNAYHAMSDSGGVLTVKLKRSDISDRKDFFAQDMIAGDYLELEISDTGHGMDKETMAKAFDPYFTTKDIGRGTGFGLALVHAIIEEHGGYIDAKSQMGEGSSIYIFLPIVKEGSDDDKNQEDSKVLKGGNEVIMVVDDEGDIRRIIRLFLEDLGYSVATFENGAQAIEAFEKKPQLYDLIITDMTMPKMAGDEFAMKALHHRSDIPVILCTGYSETMSEEQALEIGIKQYITKPVNNKDLAVLIRSILDGEQDG